MCGRSHSLYEVYTSIDAIHAASPPTWSLDLISGLPHLTEDHWHESLDKALDAEAPHISVYDLQVCILKFRFSPFCFCIGCRVTHSIHFKLFIVITPASSVQRHT